MAEGRQKGREPTEDEEYEMRHAIFQNNVTKIKKMITGDGIDVNAKFQHTSYNGWTALHWAARNNKPHIIKKLVELGADITITERGNDTPLDLAIKRNNINSVSYFITQLHQDISKIKQENKEKIQGMKKVKKYFERKEKIEEKAFCLALRDGKAKPLGIKLLLFGAENSGKTCVAATLVDDPFQECGATEGADLAICNTTNWNKISHEQMTQRLQSEYLLNLKGCAVNKSHDAKANVEASIFTKAFESFTSLVRIRIKKPIPKVDTDEIKEARETEDTDVAEKVNIDVTILDFAGQVQYHNTHSVFIRKENVIMVIFNASQPLSEKIKVRSGSKNPSTMTNSQNIHFWMKTVHSVCRQPGDENDKASLLPVILLVATHLDLLKGSPEEAKEEIIQELAKELEGKPYAQHLAGHREEGLLNALRKYCIFISNKIRDPVSISKLQDTLVKISLPILSKEQPLVFLKIERELLGHQKGVITTEEFHAISCSCGFLAEVNSKEFAYALEYFHHRGTVLHFPSIKSLKGLVILSPHWLTKLFSYVLIAHPYRSIGGKEDISFKILTEKGILLGSFLTFMLEKFNNSERVGGFEIQRVQTIDIIKKFGFVAQVTPKAEFLEETTISNEKEIFIVPSLLPEDTTNQQQIPEVDDINVRVVYFYLPDHFLPPILFDQMVTKCIDRNEFKSEKILWLRKGKAMMALSHGQCYYISLCEEKFSIQLSFALQPGERHLAEDRRELLKYFQTHIIAVMKDFMNATSEPIVYIPCCFCSQLHIKLQSLLNGEQDYCPNNRQSAVPKQHYSDLLKDQVATVDVNDSTTAAFDCSAANEKVKANYDRLTNLPIDSMLGKLYSKGVITLEEKERIESKSVQHDKVNWFLDNIVTRSLLNNISIKFKRFLEVMEESGDPILTDMAKVLGGSKVIPQT